MRALDKRTIQEYGLPGVVLMENAGKTTAELIWQHLGSAAGCKIAILCGGGNNGGDGFVVGRWLTRWGAEVVFHLLADPEKISGDARINYLAAKRLDLDLKIIRTEADLDALAQELAGCDFIVDALLGTGLKAEVRGAYRRVIEAMNAAPAPVAAVDIPSGLSADDGRVMGLAVRAELTATFGLAKVGQLIHPGREYCGRLEVVDISIPKRFVDESGISCFELEAADAAAWWPRLPADAHKGSAGHLLVLAGSPGKTGAACLTAEGALRAGAGLVTVGCPLSLNPILEAKLTEAMTQPLAETSEATLGLVSKSGVESIMAGKTALAIGPGLSPHPEVGELLAWLLGACDKPTVIDADALNLLAKQPELIKKTAAPLVLTPHPGEMARLMGLAPAQIQADRVDFARQGAREWSQVVVLKGANSLIAAPDGRVFVNPTGNAGLASGGSGDVLTGLISALLAQGVEPLKAACAGVFVHGLAADRLWNELGGRGYIAGEVAREVPAAAASLGKPF